MSVVQYTFTHKQYIEQLSKNNTINNRTTQLSRTSNNNTINNTRTMPEKPWRPLGEDENVLGPRGRLMAQGSGLVFDWIQLVVRHFTPGCDMFSNALLRCCPATACRGNAVIQFCLRLVFYAFALRRCYCNCGKLRGSAVITSFFIISQNVAICPKTFSNSIDSYC